MVVRPDVFPTGFRFARVLGGFRSSISFESDQKVGASLNLDFGLATLESLAFEFAKPELTAGRLNASGILPPVPRSLIALRLDAVQANVTVVAESKTSTDLTVQMNPVHFTSLPAKQRAEFALGVAGLTLPAGASRLDVSFLTSGFSFDRELAVAGEGEVGKQISWDAQGNILALTNRSLCRVDVRSGKTEALLETENLSGFFVSPEAKVSVGLGTGAFESVDGTPRLKFERTGPLAGPIRTDFDDNLYIASIDRRALECFGKDGKLRWRAPLPDPVASFDVDDKGNVFALCPSSLGTVVYRLEPQVRKAKVWTEFKSESPASFPKATLIRWLPYSRTLLVGDSNRGSFGLFTTEGNFLRAGSGDPTANLTHLIDVIENKRGDLFLFANTNDQRRKAVKILRKIG